MKTINTAYSIKKIAFIAYRLYLPIYQNGILRFNYVIIYQQAHDQGRCRLIILFKMNKSSERRNLSLLYRPPPPEDYSQNYCRLTSVIVLATIFIALEVIGGTLSGSIAIISDAIHLVSDLLGFVFSILFLYLSKKEMDEKVTFGYHRMELIGALINIFIVWAMVLFIMYEATLRIIHKQFVEKPFIMLITAGGGLLINIILYKILHGGASHSHGLLNDHDCDHDHDHGHQHQHKHGHQHQHHEHKHQSQHKSHHQHKHKQGEECTGKNNKKDHQHHEGHKHHHDQPHLAQDQLNAPFLKKQPNAQSKQHICTGNHNHHHHQHSEEHQEHQHEKSQEGHGHQHGHKQHSDKSDLNQEHHVHKHQEHQEPRKHQSIGMKSAVIHALSDLVQSVGVVISALIIFFFGSNQGAQVTQWNAYHLFDPIATYIFSILSLIATVPVIRNCYYLLLQSSPDHINLKDLQEEFQKIDGVIDVHDIHVWDLKPGKTIVMAHVLTKAGTERMVLMNLTDLCRRLKIFHSTFQVEEELSREDYIRCHNDIH